MTGTNRRTFTVKEAAHLLGVSVSTCREAIRAGQIPAIRCGRRVLVPVQALERLLDGSMLGHGHPPHDGGADTS